MSSNFWRFASTLEKEFHVPYDRDREVVLCPVNDYLWGANFNLKIILLIRKITM